MSIASQSYALIREQTPSFLLGVIFPLPCGTQNVLAQNPFLRMTICLEHTRSMPTYPPRDNHYPLGTVALQSLACSLTLPPAPMSGLPLTVLLIPPPPPQTWWVQEVSRVRSNLPLNIKSNNKGEVVASMLTCKHMAVKSRM